KKTDAMLLADASDGERLHVAGVGRVPLGQLPPLLGSTDDAVDGEQPADMQVRRRADDFGIDAKADAQLFSIRMDNRIGHQDVAAAQVWGERAGETGRDDPPDRASR